MPIALLSRKHYQNKGFMFRQPYEFHPRNIALSITILTLCHRNFAQKLFDAGFKDIDRCAPSIDGSSSYYTTPFILACCQGQFRVADWFLKMGARTRIDLDQVPYIAQCLLASSFAGNTHTKKYLRQLGLLRNLKKAN